MAVTWFVSNLCKFRIVSDLNLGNFLIQALFRAEIFDKGKIGWKCYKLSNLAVPDTGAPLSYLF